MQEIINSSSGRAKDVLQYANKMEKAYNLLLKDAMSQDKNDKMFLYIYHNGKISFTGELSNELTYNMPEKFIIVGRQKEDRIVMSLRSSRHQIPAVLDKALHGLDGHGGGHAHSCGASVARDDFDEFIKRIKKLI